MRVRLDVGYDGTDFSGWAAQPGRRTVAGVLLAELTRIVGADGATGLTVAGRTDAGVHATGQVCHVDIAEPAWVHYGQTLLRRLAGLLPPDVRVFAVTEVPDSFDARFSATFRRYRYQVCDAPSGAPPLLHRYVLGWPRVLELEALNAAAAKLAGEHDFAAYCRKKEHATTVREITALRWRRGPDGLLSVDVQADAFCQAMVRSLVGAMIAVGEGRRPVEWPGELLARRVRADEVPVAPPHGLTLVEVGYPDDAAGYARQAELTRRRREVSM